jgi:cellular nucleic acid-binding protein
LLRTVRNRNETLHTVAHQNFKTLARRQSVPGDITDFLRDVKIEIVKRDSSTGIDEVFDKPQENSDKQSTINTENPFKMPKEPPKSRYDKNEESEDDKMKALFYEVANSLKGNQTLQIDTLKNESQNVNHWFDRFERMTATWSDTDKAIKIPLYLESTALHVWKRMKSTEKSKFSLIKDELIEALRPRNKATRAKTEFYSARQEHGESVDEFVNRLYDFREDWPTQEHEAFDREIGQRFIDGVSNEIGKIVELLDPRKMTELVKAAKSIERRITNEASNVMIESAVYKKSPSKCFKCNKPGHWAKECAQGSNLVTAEPEFPEVKIPCIFCGKRDHYSIDCEVYESKTGPRRSINMETKPEAKKTLTCSYCKKANHEVKECRLLNKTCFRCGNAGHQIKECPVAKN